MPEQFVNYPTTPTTLNGAITSGAVSLVVASAAVYPTTGNFRILIDQEIMLVTAVAGTTFTVVRGVEGTTANAHNNGVPVSQIGTAGGVTQALQDNWQQGETLDYSPVQVLGAASTSQSASRSCSTVFAVMQVGHTIQGVLVYWTAPSGSPSLTLKASLWQGGARLASGTVTVTTTGVYFIAFSVPYVVPSAGVSTAFFATVWETSGTYYTRTLQSAVSTGLYATAASGVPVYAAKHIYWANWNAEATGDAQPATYSSTEAYPVEPVITLASTTVTASFTQPAFGSTVTLAVTSTANMLIGMSAFIPGGGPYKVMAIGSGTSVTVINVGDVTNSSPSGTVVPTGAGMQW